MRLMQFNYSIHHEAGKSFLVPDTLSRAPLSHNSDRSIDILDEETELFVRSILTSLPATDRKLDEIREAVASDDLCQAIRGALSNGNWESFRNSEFYKEQGNLSYLNGLILRGIRIFIPKKMRTDVLNQIHSGHFGVNKCLARAKETVWWPGITADVKRLVSTCSSCLKHRRNPAEPLRSSPIPSRPWQVIGADLFEYERQIFLCIQDYFSKFIEMITLNKTTTESLTKAYMSIFSRHGIPNIVRSDNGTPLVSREMQVFAKELGFQIVTSSPHFPQSNGQAERAVEICKGILKKNADPYLGLLAYRSSPLECGLSPAELLFGRRLRTTLPSTLNQLDPSWPYLNKYRESWKVVKNQNKKYFDKRHRARNLKPLEPGSKVWITDLKRNGTVIGRGTTDRDYIIKTGDREIRRNRVFLIPVLEKDDSKPDWTDLPCTNLVPDIPSSVIDGFPENRKCGEEEEAEEEDKEEAPVGTRDEEGRRGEEEDREGHRGMSAGGHYITRYGRVVRPPQKYC